MIGDDLRGKIFRETLLAKLRLFRHPNVLSLPIGQTSFAQVGYLPRFWAELALIFTYVLH